MSTETDELEELRSLLFPKDDEPTQPTNTIGALFTTPTDEEN